jgi:hypothetical protein
MILGDSVCQDMKGKGLWVWSLVTISVDSLFIPIELFILREIIKRRIFSMSLQKPFVAELYTAHNPLQKERIKISLA